MHLCPLYSFNHTYFCVIYFISSCYFYGVHFLKPKKKTDLIFLSSVYLLVPLSMKIKASSLEMLLSSAIAMWFAALKLSCRNSNYFTVHCMTPYFGRVWHGDFFPYVDVFVCMYILMKYVTCMQIPAKAGRRDTVFPGVTGGYDIPRCGCSAPNCFFWKNRKYSWSLNHSFQINYLLYCGVNRKLLYGTWVVWTILESRIPLPTYTNFVSDNCKARLSNDFLPGLPTCSFDHLKWQYGHLCPTCTGDLIVIWKCPL